jgi:hypothetical protein
MARPHRGLSAAGSGLCVALWVGSAIAQSDDAVAQARATFAEGIGDENAGRYETALAEFQRVAAFRETANVRFRIASCLESLGRRAEALASYEATVRLGEGDPSGADAVAASSERAAQLGHIVAQLTIALPSPTPSGTELHLDDGALDPATLGAPIRVDPGNHTITVTSPGFAPFRSGVTLIEGSRLRLAIDLVPLGEPRESGAVSEPRSPPVAGYVAFGVAGALAAGSIVSLVLRASNLATLDRDCTPGAGGSLSCPRSSMREVDSAHDDAKVQGPLAIGLGVGAAVAVGVGIWLVLSPRSKAAPHSSGMQVVPLLFERGGGLAFIDSI